MNPPCRQPYVTLPAARVAASTPPVAWLVDGLFLQGAAGILGGAPKSGKSFLALELAVSIATGSPFASLFRVALSGPVLLVGAEDPPAVVVDRLALLSASRGQSLDCLPVHLVVEPGVRLPDGIHRLQATVAKLAPRLLILDPLIRLHRADENSAAEMSVILDGLRSLARESLTSVLVVHHARKAMSGGSPGQGLRGSSDLAAFGDTNLYLRRLGPDATLELKIEHRAAQSPPPLLLRLRVEQGPPPLARFIAGDGPAVHPIRERVLAVLRAAHEPVSAAALRESVGVRNQLLVASLHALEADGRIHRVGRQGWITSAIVPVPAPMCGNGNGLSG